MKIITRVGISFLLFSIVLFLTIDEIRCKDGDSCNVNPWSQWSACTHPCGISGIQTRTRPKDSSKNDKYCPLREDRPCNRGNCQNGGTPNLQGCACFQQFSGRCCENKNGGTSNNVVCENKLMRLDCPINSTLLIHSANYGRKSKSICQGANSHTTTKCRAGNSFKTVQGLCNGRRSCSVSASNSIFGDPCIGVFKYLEVQFSCVTQKPCTSYIAENNEQRSTAYIVKTGSVSQSGDRQGFTPGWYRFTSGAGGEMPTSCPPERACGAQGSIWLDGSHPKNVGEERTVRGCVRVGSKCCAKEILNSIKIKKCSKDGKEYFVYNLPLAPGSGMRYCAGKEKRCPGEEISATGFTPGCTSKYPRLNRYPEVTVGVHNSRIRFTCKIDSKDKGENVRHEVSWYEGPPEMRLMKTTLLKGAQTEAYLQNTHTYGDSPIFCLGKNIYCKVASYYDDKVETSGKATRKSNEFFAGFVINPKVIDLPEKNKPAKITITTTVPIVCQDGTENCLVFLEVGQTNLKDAFVDWCTLNFKPGPPGQTRELEVVAKRDFVDDGDQTMFIKLFVPDHINPVDWNCYRNITDVKVVTKDIRTARCKSTGDPHIVTLDGFYYNHFHIGDYVMVDSKARLFKVHVRTFRCHTVSCNCGVAVREGDDVVVVDMCRDNVPRARFASTVEPQEGTTIERSQNGKSFVLNFPSGAYVRFEAKKWFRRWYFANIIVQLPSDDYGNTTGLCGTYDGDKDNDMKSKDGQVYSQLQRRRVAPTGFTESWKVGANESLFYYKGGERKCKAERIKSYCTCSEECCDKAKRKIRCDFEGYSKRPTYKQGFFGWKKLQFPGAEHCGKRRKRRSLDENTIILPDDGKVAVYEYNPKDIQPTVGDFPTKSGITQAQAEMECKNAIKNSAAGKTCLQTINGFDTQPFEEQCVLDVQVLDDLKPAKDSIINSMADACEEITLREIKKYWKGDADGTLEPPSNIADSICPNDCSGNGVCQNATCVCTSGFISSDCSMKAGEPPVLINIPYNGLCDIRNQDCLRTRVVGYNFLDSPELTCRTTEVTISDSKTVQTSDRKNIVGSQLLSFAELSCSLPRVPVIIDGDIDRLPGKPAGGFYIELSNDGKTFSPNKTLLIVYDSKCMECSKDDVQQEQRTCKWKTNSCKMNNYCFADGDANPKDWCQICDPSRSRTAFVKRTKNLAPVFKVAQILNVFKGQRWRYEIPVSDPEKQYLKYEFIGNSHGMGISSAGILTWFPIEANKTYSFTVKATDPCGNHSQNIFQVKTHYCQCEGQNGGVCIWQKNTRTGITEPVCKCPEGCEGTKCTDAIMGRICRIQGDNGSSKKKSNSTVVTVVVVIVVAILLVVLLVVGSVIYKLKKEKKDINAKNFKEASISSGKNAKSKVVRAAVTAYNKAHHKKDQNVAMKSGALEKTNSSQVNPGYTPEA